MSKRTDEWRRKRMAELAEKLGGKAALGRKLGYKSGAYVRQMIDGELPITEKTIEAIHAMPGFDHWFDRPGSGPAIPLQVRPAPSAPTGAFSALTVEEIAFLEDVRVLLDADLLHYRTEIAAKATQMREHMKKVMSGLKLPETTKRDK